MVDANAMSQRTSRQKRKIMKALYENSKIVELIDNKDISEPDQLINVNIFPLMKVPNTQEEAKTMICVKIDYPNVMRNDVIKNCQITFTTISHVSHNTTTRTKEPRTDLITEEIIDEFNLNDTLGFRWHLVSDTEGAFIEDWYSRVVIFKADRLNGLEDGKRFNG